MLLQLVWDQVTVSYLHLLLLGVAWNTHTHTLFIFNSNTSNDC